MSATGKFEDSGKFLKKLYIHGLIPLLGLLSSRIRGSTLAEKLSWSWELPACKSHGSSTAERLAAACIRAYSYLAAKEIDLWRAEFTREELVSILKNKLRESDRLNEEINHLLIKYFDGVHPKHLLHPRYYFFRENIDKNDIVLDLGCGHGYMANRLARHCRGVIAVDRNPPYGKFKRANLNFITADINDFVDNHPSVDYTVAILSHILEHLENPVALLSRLKCPKVIVLVPRREQWLVEVKRRFGILSWISDPSHYRLYTRELLREHLKLGGFSRIELLEFDGDDGIRAVAYRD